MATAILTNRGQTTIPKEVREQLRLRPGDRMEFLVQKDGTALLVPKRVHVSELEGILQSSGHVSLVEMEHAIRLKASGQ